MSDNGGWHASYVESEDGTGDGVQIWSPYGQTMLVCMGGAGQLVVMIEPFINDESAWQFEVIPDAAMCSDRIVVDHGNRAVIEHFSADATVLRVPTTSGREYR